MIFFTTNLSSQSKEFLYKEYLISENQLELQSDKFIPFEVKHIEVVSGDSPFSFDIGAFIYGEQKGVILTSYINTENGGIQPKSTVLTIDEFQSFYNFFKNLNPKDVKESFLYVGKNGLKIEVIDLSFGQHDSPKRVYGMWLQVDNKWRQHKFDEKTLDKLYEELSEYFELKN